MANSDRKLLGNIRKRFGRFADVVGRAIGISKKAETVRPTISYPTLVTATVFGEGRITPDDGNRPSKAAVSERAADLASYLNKPLPPLLPLPAFESFADEMRGVFDEIGMEDEQRMGTIVIGLDEKPQSFRLGKNSPERTPPVQSKDAGRLEASRSPPGPMPRPASAGPTREVPITPKRGEAAERINTAGSGSIRKLGPQHSVELVVNTSRASLRPEFDTADNTTPSETRYLDTPSPRSTDASKSLDSRWSMTSSGTTITLPAVHDHRTDGKMGSAGKGGHIAPPAVSPIQDDRASLLPTLPATTYDPKTPERNFRVVTEAGAADPTALAFRSSTFLK